MFRNIRAFSSSSSASSAAGESTSILHRPIFWASIIAIGGVAALVGRRSFGGGSGGGSSSGSKPPAAAVKKGKQALNPSEFIPFKLASVKHESHNSAVFRFSFDDPSDYAGMSIASCLVTKFDKEVVDSKTGEKKVSSVIRPYTPISDPEQTGYLDLLIKKYPGGQMTEHIFSLKPGDTLLFKGPFDKILYESNKWNHVGMLAGGTGITPMWQVIKRALDDKNDKTRITLLYANVSPDDILLKKEIDSLAKTHADRFKVYYAIDKPTEGWKGFTGYINADMYAKAHLPTVSDEKSIVFVCGNDPMTRALSGPKAKDKSQGEIDPKSLLGKMGFTKEQVYKF